MTPTADVMRWCRDQETALLEMIPPFETGKMRITHNGVDVSAEHVAFLARAAANMRQLIEAYERPNA